MPRKDYSVFLSFSLTVSLVFLLFLFASIFARSGTLTLSVLHCTLFWFSFVSLFSLSLFPLSHIHPSIFLSISIYQSICFSHSADLSLLSFVFLGFSKLALILGVLYTLFLFLINTPTFSSQSSVFPKSFLTFSLGSLFQYCPYCSLSRS